MIKRKLGLCTMMIIIAMSCMLTACSCSNTSDKRVSDIEYTIVENEDVPKELLEIINNKKTNSMQLTYKTKEYLYMVIGYGTQKTSGYSIRLNDIYIGENAIYVDSNLLGPAKGEITNETPSYPYMVIKVETRELPVIFN